MSEDLTNKKIDSLFSYLTLSISVFVRFAPDMNDRYVVWIIWDLHLDCIGSVCCDYRECSDDGILIKLSLAGMLRLEKDWEEKKEE